MIDEEDEESANIVDKNTNFDIEFDLDFDFLFHCFINLIEDIVVVAFPQIISSNQVAKSLERS